MSSPHTVSSPQSTPGHPSTCPDGGSHTTDAPHASRLGSHPSRVSSSSETHTTPSRGRARARPTCGKAPGDVQARVDGVLLRCGDKDFRVKCEALREVREVAGLL